MKIKLYYTLDSIVLEKFIGLEIMDSISSMSSSRMICDTLAATLAASSKATFPVLSIRASRKFLGWGPG